MASVELIVPSLATNLSGNSVTANRYGNMLAALGHSAVSVPSPSGQADLVVALNAYRSAKGISHAASVSGSPIVVVLTGTDVYRYLDTHTDVVHASLDQADRLVGFNDRIGDSLGSRHRQKLVVIKEGATAGQFLRSPSPQVFTVAVVGHLRDEKDPEVVVDAIRDLPRSCPVDVHHYGAAHTDDWASWARSESDANDRYHWHGQVDRAKIETVYASSHVLVNSSLMEGGANSISEAIMAGLPVLASDIPGNIGVLGSTYTGYFTRGKAPALRAALLEIASTPGRLERMTQAVTALQPGFTEEEERGRWAALLAGFGL